MGCSHQDPSAICLIVYKRHNAFTERNSTMMTLMLVATIARLLIVNTRFAWTQAAVPVSRGGHASEDTASRPSRSLMHAQAGG